MPRRQHHVFPKWRSKETILTLTQFEENSIRSHCFVKPTGSRAAYWDGRNALGEPVASGVYFYTLKAGDFTATRKMLIKKIITTQVATFVAQPFSLRPRTHNLTDLRRTRPDATCIMLQRRRLVLYDIPA